MSGNQENNGIIASVNTYKPPIGESNVDLMKDINGFSEYALKGIIQDTPLSDIFFSKQNIEGIQQTIRYKIFQEYGKVIDYQSQNDVFVVMRSIFLQKGDSGVRSNQIKPHIRMLNDEVIQYCVGEIGVQLLQHENYLDKINNLPIPLEHPKYEKESYTYDTSNLL